MNLYRGYVPTKNKEPQMKFKRGQKLMTLNEVENLPEYAGVLDSNTILIDIDEQEQSEIMMNIVEDLQLDCKVIQTSRGKHFLFKNSGVGQCYIHVNLACGLKADIKVGCKNSTEVLKFDGQDRFVEWDVDDGQEYMELPKWMHPVKGKMEFLDMDAGDGRNQALFSYELVLQSSGLDVEQARTAIRIINKYVLKEPLSESELDVILRDEAFQMPVFYDGKTFLFNKFATYMKSQFHIKRINGQLHVYKEGIYVTGYKFIENMMVQVIPTLKANQRTEILKYLEIITPEESYPSDANLIAFNNGILDLTTMELKEFHPDIVITNRIPWNYVPNAYSEVADHVLDRIACSKKEIRNLLEECIGYCFYRRNEKSKSFFLTGSGSNGKSTYLDMVKWVLGRQNYVSLDLEELSERFSTSTMYGKLANIGDDISDEFLQGKQISQFKKLVSGNDVKAENKGQDVFFFKPTVKLLFSANEIPRMRNKGFSAIKRRMVIIPFNAVFSSNDDDYDEYIIYKLKTPEVAEYLVQLGIAGLQRILSKESEEGIEKEDGFTVCQEVKKELEEFEMNNNPILLFLEETDKEEILNHETKVVFARYDTFCVEGGFQKMAMQTFTKEIKSRLDCDVKQARVNGKKTRVFFR